MKGKLKLPRDTQRTLFITFLSFAALLIVVGFLKSGFVYVAVSVIPALVAFFVIGLPNAKCPKCGFNCGYRKITHCPRCRTKLED